jgi:hypothetical protein
MPELPNEFHVDVKLLRKQLEEFIRAKGNPIYDLADFIDGKRRNPRLVYYNGNRLGGKSLNYLYYDDLFPAVYKKPEPPTVEELLG